MAFPQNTTPLDDFNRANANLSPTANWTAILNGGLSVISNQVGTANVDLDCDARWIGSSFTANQEAGLTIAAKPGATAYGESLWLRAAVSTADGYRFYAREVAGATDEWKIYKSVSGTLTQLGSTTTGPERTAGDKIGATAIGNALTFYVFQSSAWSQVMTLTDSTFTGAGHIGFGLSADGSLLTRVDDFFGGSITPGIVYARPRPTIYRL